MTEIQDYTDVPEPLPDLCAGIPRWRYHELWTELAEGSARRVDLARKYDVSRSAITQFARRHRGRIEEIRAKIDEEFVGSLEPCFVPEAGVRVVERYLVHLCIGFRAGPAWTRSLSQSSARRACRTGHSVRDLQPLFRELLAQGGHGSCSPRLVRSSFGPVGTGRPRTPA